VALITPDVGYTSQFIKIPYIQSMRVLWFIFLTGCNVASAPDVTLPATSKPDVLAQVPDSSAQTQKSLSVGEPQGPIETFLFCHESTEETPRSIPLRYRQMGDDITPIPKDSNLYYVPNEADRKIDTWERCENTSLKVLPAEYEWKDGLIEGEMSLLKYTPSIYGYIDVRKAFERGPVQYSPNIETQLTCYQIIEMNVPTPIVLTPVQNETLKIPYKHKDGQTLVMTSPPLVVSGEPEDGCQSVGREYKFERRSLDGNVLNYFQTLDVAIP